MRCAIVALALIAAVSTAAQAQQSQYFDLPKGDYPHDVAAGPNGDVW